MGKNENSWVGWPGLTKNLGQDFQNSIITAGSQISEQNAMVFGSRFSELGKFGIGMGLEKRG